MMTSRRSTGGATLLLLFLIWLSAPPLHHLLEHCEEEGEHHTCSLFHNLSPLNTPPVVDLPLISDSTAALPQETTSATLRVAHEHLAIRAPPISGR